MATISGVPAHAAGSRPGGRLEALLLLDRQLEFLSDAGQGTDSIWAFLADPAAAMGVPMTLEPTVPETGTASTAITAAAVAELYAMSDWRRTGVPTDWLTYVFYTEENGNELEHVESWITDIIIHGKAPLRVVDATNNERNEGSIGNAFASVASAGNVALATYLANKYPEQVRKLHVLQTSLRVAAEHARDPAIIPLLVRLGADIHAQRDEALLIAVRHKNGNMVAALLAAGADPNAESVDTSVMYWAGLLNQPNILRQLIMAGAGNEYEYGNVLRMAASNGYADIVQIVLLARTDDVRAYQDDVLRIAARNNHLDIVKLLLEFGADPRANNNAALTEAMKAGNTEVADYLRQWMAEHPPGTTYGTKRQKIASKMPVLQW